MSSEFVIGAVLAGSVFFGWRPLSRWALRLAHSRRRIAVGYLLGVLRGSMDNGKRISYRKLVNSPSFFGRSYGLILLKQGPNEPTAERTVAAPFTEPLDDPDSNNREEAGER